MPSCHLVEVIIAVVQAKDCNAVTEVIKDSAKAPTSLAEKDVWFHIAISSKWL